MTVKVKDFSAEGGYAPVASVAKFLGVSRSKLYSMMDAGELAYIKLGKSRRIAWEAVYKLVAENTIGGGVR